MHALLTDLRESVRIAQRAAGNAQSLLSGTADPTYGTTKTIDLARVLHALTVMEDTAREAIERIAAEATAAGVREKAARRG